MTRTAFAGTDLVSGEQPMLNEPASLLTDNRRNVSHVHGIAAKMERNVQRFNRRFCKGGTGHCAASRRAKFSGLSFTFRLSLGPEVVMNPVNVADLR